MFFGRVTPAGNNMNFLFVDDANYQKFSHGQVFSYFVAYSRVDTPHASLPGNVVQCSVTVISFRLGQTQYYLLADSFFVDLPIELSGDVTVQTSQIGECSPIDNLSRIWLSCVDRCQRNPEGLGLL